MKRHFLLILFLFIVLSYVFLEDLFSESELYYVSEIKDFLPPEATTPGYIYGADILPNRNLVLALPQSVLVIDSSGNYITQIGKTGSGEGEYRVPWKIGTDGNGEIYVLDQMGKKIIHYDKNGLFKNEIAFTDTSQFNFVITKDGKIVTPDTKNNELVISDKNGKVINKIHPNGMYLITFAKGKNNTILVVETELYGTELKYFVYRYSNNGDFIQKIPIDVDANSIYPGVILESGSEYFYFIDIKNQALIRISQKGKVLWIKQKLPIPESIKTLSNLSNATFDFNGNTLYITDGMNERILKFKEYPKLPVFNNSSFYVREAEKYKKINEDKFLCYMNLALLGDPKNAEILENIGKYYHQSGNYKKAIGIFKKILGLQPENNEIKNLLEKDQVLLLVKTGDRLSEIVRHLTKDYGPNYATNQFKRAIDSYREAFKLSNDPEIEEKIVELKKVFSSGSETIPEITVEKIYLEQNVFSAMYKFYNNNPIGRITVKNTTGHKLEWIKAELNVKEYMDYPTETEIKRNIMPGARTKLKLYAVFNNSILDVTEDTPIGVNVKISYSIDKKTYTIKQNLSFKLFNRNAMIWDDQNKLASFITPKDPAVKIFARETIQSFRNSRFEFLNNSLQSAIQIFDTLSVYGITYIPDPKTPYIEFSKNPALVDYIQYPRDTLRFKTGDCDDLTVLFASLLENIGIETATVTVPEHIFLIFNTEVPVSRRRSISNDSSLLFPYMGKIWIPVETTLLGDSFLKAWDTGAREIARFRNKLGIAVTKDSWKHYTPVTLKQENWEPSVPDRNYSEQLYFDDINNLIERELTRSLNSIEKSLKSNPENPRLYNKLGVTYARYGKYTDAEASFKKAIKLKPDYFSPYNNLGNIYFLQGNYDKALKYYRKALRINPQRSSIYINMAFIFKKKNDMESMIDSYKKAVSLNKNLENEYKIYFEKESSKKTGYSSRAYKSEKKPAIIWDEIF